MVVLGGTTVGAGGIWEEGMVLSGVIVSLDCDDSVVCAPANRWTLGGVAGPSAAVPPVNRNLLSCCVLRFCNIIVITRMTYLLHYIMDECTPNFSFLLLHQLI